MGRDRRVRRDVRPGRPKSGAAEYVPQSLRKLEETQKLFRAFEGLEPITTKSLVKVDNRYVRIVKIQAREGFLDVTFETVRGEDVERSRLTGAESK